MPPDTEHNTPRSRGPGLTAVYLWAAAGLTALRMFTTPLPPFDLWWHLAMGRIIVTEQAIPLVDRFSFTRAGQPFFDQSWLAQVVLYGIHRLGGVPLLIVFQALVLCATYGMLLWLVARRTGRPRLAVLLLLVVIQPLSFDAWGIRWGVRPQGLALPLFAACLLLLTGYRRRWWQTLWPLVPLIALWANLHGSFFLGLLMIAAVLLGEGIRQLRRDETALTGPEWRRLALWGASAALAMLINPRGPGLLLYVRNLAASPSVARVASEWAPPNPHDGDGAFFLLFVCGLLALLAYARRDLRAGPQTRPDPTDLCLLFPLLWLSFTAGRSIVWLGMAAFPPLADAVASLLPKEESRAHGIPLVNGALIALLALPAILALPWVKQAAGLEPRLGPLLSRDTPVAAVKMLRSLPAGRRPRRLFCALGFGSYLTWAAPEQPVFIDSRMELYPYSQWQDTICLGLGLEVPELLARYRIDGLLLEPRGQALLRRAALASGKWRVEYEDDGAVLLLPAGGGIR